MRLIFSLLLLVATLQQQTQQNAPTEEEIEALKALPYVQWTDKDADKKLRGVTFQDKKRAYAGYNLYTNVSNEIYLLDMAGARIHTWKLPGKENCEEAKLLTNGEAIATCVGSALVKMDLNSTVQWEVPGFFHHDVTPLPDGTFLTLMYSHHRYRNFDVAFDSIVHLSRTGQLLDRWSTFENLTMLQKIHAPDELDLPCVTEKILLEKKGSLAFDYYHLNTVESLPENRLGKKDERFRPGNFMIASRNADFIAIIHKVTKQVVWHWGPGEIQGPHAPIMLPTGHILVFDNGTRRNYSRIIELDPLNNKIVWEYRGNPPESFFSAWRGSAQRLPNGNTLICNSESGQVFEVTTKGKVVWEFWNPIFQGEKRKRIYRFKRLAPEKVSDFIQ